MLGLLAGVAAAQEPVATPDLNAQLYRPPIDARTTLWSEAAGTVVEGFAARPSIALHYVNRPLVYLREDGELTVLLSDALQLDAIFATAVDRFRVAVDVPVVLYAAGLGLGGPGVGDVALDVRATVLDPAERASGLALDARVAFPSATVPMLGDEAIGAELFLVGEQRLGERVVLVENLGHRIAPRAPLENVEVDDQLVARLGLGVRLSDRGGLSADLAGRAALADAANPASIPIEALLGGHLRLTDDLVLRLGAGRGLTPGIGSSQARLVALLGYDPLPVRDADLDGLVDAEDACPAEPEDRDGWRDGDGCPDPSQRVELVAQDPDGAPLPARIDLSGPAPLAAVGTSPVALELHEGAWLARAELDGWQAATAEVSVPGAARVVLTLEPLVVLGELHVTVLDEDGRVVPEAIWTIDDEPGPPLVEGVAVARVPEGPHTVGAAAPGLLPATAEVRVGRERRAEEILVLRAPRVSVTRERVEVRGTIYFETAQAVIRPESFPLLDEVATELRDRPEIARVRIEGHTDARGSEAFNQGLSERRAAAVRQYLVARGVAPERLVSVGFGESRPVDPRDVPEAWDRNRRVEFFIEERR